MPCGSFAFWSIEDIKKETLPLTAAMDFSLYDC